VDQLALPYRIGLGALLVVAALWFTILKPGPVEAPEPAPAAPGVTGLGNAVKGAKGAVATANAAGEAAAADPTAEATAASGAKAAAGGKPAVEQPAGGARQAREERDEAAPLLRDLRAGKVVVLAFLGRGSDDRAVRSALATLSTHRGSVTLRKATVDRVGRYGAITAGVKVVGTPTVLVLGKGPKARAVTGLTTTAELDQAVVDMLERTRR
jgi:hypothetical protein